MGILPFYYYIVQVIGRFYKTKDNAKLRYFVAMEAEIDIECVILPQ